MVAYEMQRPFVNYYGPSILLYELSSPFLNFHWFFDKCGMTGSLPQLINGICLITTFFSCRLVWGTYMTILVFGDVWKALNYAPTNSLVNNDISAKYIYNDGIAASTTTKSAADAEVMRFVPLHSETNQLDLRIPLWLAASYLASNLVLHGLNVFWFGRMIETIRKRFDPPFGTRRTVVENEKEDVKMAVTSAAEGLAAVTPANGDFAASSGTDSGGVGKRTRRRAY